MIHTSLCKVPAIALLAPVLSLADGGPQAEPASFTAEPGVQASSLRDTEVRYGESDGRSPVRDAYIAGRLVTAFSLSEHLAPFNIGIQVRDAAVTLTGSVDSEVLADLAVEVASTIDEIATVNSRIRVRPGAPQAAAPEKDSFVRRFADAGVTARVKTRLLWNDSTDGLDIGVDTDHHVVTLSGRVDSAAQRELAHLVAYNTDGVRQVVNRLAVDVPDGTRSAEQRSAARQATGG